MAIESNYNPKDLILLTPNDVMEILNISKTGIYRLVDKRAIPYYRVGGSLRFDRKDVREFLERNKVNSMAFK